MSLLYLGYMTLVAIGIVAFVRVFNLSFSPKQTWSALNAIGLIAIPFVIWDVLAVERGHWSFGLEHTVGILILNQPLEEILFFILVPAFGIILWEMFKGGKRA